MQRMITFHVKRGFVLSFLLLALFGAKPATAQVKIDFKDTFLTDICVNGAIVKMTAFGDSAVPGTIYYWNTGKGKIIGGKDYYFGFDTLSKIYVYDVTLTIRTPSGYVDSITKKAYLNVTPMSEPKLFMSRNLLCSVPDTISFIDQSTGVASRQWYINNKLQPDTGKKFIYTATTARMYDVKLVITSYRGCVKTLSIPKAFEAPNNLSLDFRVILNGYTTNRKLYDAVFRPVVDKRLTVVKYVWSFPGGSPSSYTSTGKADAYTTYNDVTTSRDVTLTIYTANGCMLTYTKPSVIQMYYKTDATDYCASDPAIIHNLANNNKRMGFDFNSNFPNVLTDFGSDKYGMKFRKVGKPDVYIRFIYRTSKQMDSVIIPQLFNIKAPLADFMVSNLKPCSAPASLTLKAKYTDPANSYTWQIFDSNMVEVAGSPVNAGTNASTTFKFPKLGFYTIKLKITNTNGCSDEITKENYVKIGAPLPDITFLNPKECAGDTFYVSNKSTPAEDPKDPYIHQWVVQHTDSSNIYKIYTTAQPKIVLTVPGIYTVNYKIKTSPTCLNSHEYTNALTVNGILANVALSPISPNCKPYTYKLDAVNLANVPSSAVITSYKWEALPSGGVIFSSPTSPTTNVLIKKSGCYTIRLTLQNSVGCTRVIEKIDYICAGTVPVFTIDSVACIGKAVSPQNLTLLKPDFYKWSASPAGNVTFYPSDTVKSPTLTFNKDGCYTVRLLSGKKAGAGCPDTATANICIRTPSASFTASDTLLYCQPKLVTFKNLSKNGVKYTWVVSLVNPDNTRTRIDSFVTSTTQDYTYIFHNNGYYDLKLITENSSGCAVTRLKKKLIHLVGPQAFFTVDKHTSCGNQTFIFKDKTTGSKHTFIQYGDLSPASDTIGPHYYQFVDYSQDSNVYYPTVFALNEDQCVSVDFHTEAIILYRPPKAAFRLTDSIGCAPYTTQFENITQYGNNYIWDFGDGTVPLMANDSLPVTHTFQNAGKYSVKLIAITNKGCMDSVIKSKCIVVNPTPVASIKVSDTVACYFDTLQFTGNAKSTVPIKQWFWKFNDGISTTDTSTSPNPRYHFDSSGIHKVMLVVANENGCLDTAFMIIRNKDKFPPVPPVIDYVTVTPEGDVQIFYEKSSAADFRKYYVYRDNGTSKSLIKTSTQKDDINALDLSPAVDVNNDVNGYTIQQEDECGLVSQPSLMHKTILLKAVQSSPLGISLGWSPYVGWKQIQTYEVYRMEDNNGSFRKVTSLPGTDTAYLDSPICNHTYTYYIHAIDGDNAAFASNSNRSTVKVNYILQVDPLDVTRTTVINNQYTETRWQPSVQPNVHYYSIDRYRPEFGWQEDYGTSVTTTFMDKNADINHVYYQYRVKVVDECGYESPLSNIGTSINLKADIVDDSRILHWNKYRGWSNGVQQYLVQLKDDQGVFNTVAVLKSSDTTFVDDSTHDEIHNGTCYRILAIESAGSIDQDTSISNVDCPNLESRIWVPNVFSPNDDKINEVWHIKAVSIYSHTGSPFIDFELRLFNRWGQEVWSTDDYEQGWDGRYKDAPAPEGLYLYKIVAHGVDGRKIVQTGTVLLMR